tara:strand:- start:72 stop:266 length:195 start_codon:yes stop_codon:yes gene_type:complete
MNLKIRNATPDQWSIVADMIKTNIGLLERNGSSHGIGLIRGNIPVYMYLTNSGKTVVAYVTEME